MKAIELLFDDKPGENENVLEGFRCPQCGHEKSFDIEAKSLFIEVTDDGTGEYTDVEWSDDSFCRCCECGHEGTVAGFQIEEEE